MDKKLIGKVTHYFSKIGVAVVELQDELRIGDKIRIEGPTTEIEQEVTSMQIEHQPIEVAKPGQKIGLKVINKVREKDLVFKIE